MDTAKRFKENLWFKGKMMGEVTGELKVKNFPVFHQMVCGVNTEDGF
jgi:hypothetical protein